MTIKISLEELAKVGCHLGHPVRRWNPKIAPFLYGERDGIHIFDLSKTKKCLDEALDALSEKASKNGKILFVGTKRQAKRKIEEVGKETGSFWVSERWLGGTLTNIDQIRKTLKKLDELKKMLASDEIKRMRTKKERLLLERKAARLERFFGGLSGMEKLPDLMVIVDLKKEKTALKEARQMGVETIGIVDTNADPTKVDYPIPCNDDSGKALDLILDLMKKVIIEAKVKKKKNGKD